MRTFEKYYVGVFKNYDGHEHTIKVSCLGFIEAFFLLTAKAIESGRHYQLSTITDENGITLKIKDIMKVAELFN